MLNFMCGGQIKGSKNSLKFQERPLCDSTKAFYAWQRINFPKLSSVAPFASLFSRNFVSIFEEDLRSLRRCALRSICLSLGRASSHNLSVKACTVDVLRGGISPFCPLSPEEQSEQWRGWDSSELFTIFLRSEIDSFDKRASLAIIQLSSRAVCLDFHHQNLDKDFLWLFVEEENLDLLMERNWFDLESFEFSQSVFRRKTSRAEPMAGKRN